MLVLMSLAVLCGTRFGKTFGWMVALVNLMLMWTTTELLYTGIDDFMQASISSSSQLYSDP